MVKLNWADSVRVEEMEVGKEYYLGMDSSKKATLMNVDDKQILLKDEQGKFWDYDRAWSTGGFIPVTK